MSPDIWMPSYFHWWHLPVVFVAGLVANVYGTAVGSASILIQFVLVALGMPLPNVIAVDLAADLGGIAGVLRESFNRKQIEKQKKPIFLLMLPLLLGGFVGTWLLLNIETQILRYVVAAGLTGLLIYTVLNGRRATGHAEELRFSARLYPLLCVAMFVLALYGNVCGVGSGAFMRLVFVALLHMKISSAVGLINLLALPAESISFIGTLLSGMLVWPYLLTMLVGNYIGGKYGVVVVRRIPETWLRLLLIGVVSVYVVWLLAFV